jgi:tRNA pseudouridine55 synthase
MRYHGLLLVDKPVGITSHDLVQSVRYKLGMTEVGHCGTLDPIATGLMVVLLGEATKLSQFLLERDKAYIVSFRLGLKTDSWDITGKILGEEQAVKTSIEEVLKVSSELQGDLELSVPVYSAIKVQGKKLYERARNGEVIEAVPVRKMSFYEVKYLGSPALNEYQFYLRCSKGSYIRSWVHTLGEKLACGAVMSALRRVESSPYKVEQAISLDKISEVVTSQDNKALVPLIQAIGHFKTVRVKRHSESLIRNGQISHELKRQIISVFNPEEDKGVRVMTYYPEQLLALVVLEEGKGFVVRRVFRY